MTSRSLIPSSVRKIQFIPDLSFAKKTWPTVNDTPPVIHLHDVLAFSEALSADGSGTRFKSIHPFIGHA